VGARCAGRPPARAGPDASAQADARPQARPPRFQPPGSGNSADHVLFRARACLAAEAAARGAEARLRGLVRPHRRPLRARPAGRFRATACLGPPTRVDTLCSPQRSRPSRPFALFVVQTVRLRGGIGSRLARLPSRVGGQRPATRYVTSVNTSVNLDKALRIGYNRRSYEMLQTSCAAACSSGPCGLPG